MSLYELANDPDVRSALAKVAKVEPVKTVRVRWKVRRPQKVDLAEANAVMRSIAKPMCATRGIRLEMLRAGRGGHSMTLLRNTVLAEIRHRTGYSDTIIGRFFRRSSNAILVGRTK